jgi:hypothetical protein
MCAHRQLPGCYRLHVADTDIALDVLHIRHHADYQRRQQEVLQKAFHDASHFSYFMPYP